MQKRIYAEGCRQAKIQEGGLPETEREQIYYVWKIWETGIIGILQRFIQSRLGQEKDHG